MSAARILVVDDEKNAREALARILREDGFDVATAGDAEQAVEEVTKFAPDVLITDVKMPGVSGISLMGRAREISPELMVIVVTAFGTVEDAVQAMKLGAETYLPKPVNLDALKAVLEKALEKRKLLQETRLLREQVREKYKFENIIGNGPEMMAVFSTIERVAPSRASVLIEGESGTGKELVAAAIHQRSVRANAPFVKLNCAALAETLLESELFGHERGSFTGAIARREGRFKQAAGGTLFLDEVSEIPFSTQVKLLRFLQEREFERVGGNETIKVDVRVIAATNRDLKQCVAEGKFREDLFYRLNVIAIELPPLRKRRADIPLLVRHFVDKYAKMNEKAVSEVSEAAMLRLVSYPWPGNVRELENVIERAVVLTGERTIGEMHLPPYLRGAHDPTDSGSWFVPGTTLGELERIAIMRTLTFTKGSTSRAAELLGISPRTIQYRLKEYREAKTAQVGGASAPVAAAPVAAAAIDPQSPR
ncbi:MAG: sigma-54-dependent Fis family transcriptional regulator [Deltaproteobacteria bacterium]|nr:sigma-54-dependent Fis family transcriptional regulator [Deltaproteobacteria bacterium]